VTDVLEITQWTGFVRKSGASDLTGAATAIVAFTEAPLAPRQRQPGLRRAGWQVVRGGEVYRKGFSGGAASGTEPLAAQLE